MLSSETVQSPEILGSSKYTLLCMLRDKDVVFHEQQVGFGVGVVYYISSCFKKKKKSILQCCLFCDQEFVYGWRVGFLNHRVQLFCGLHLLSQGRFWKPQHMALWWQWISGKCISFEIFVRITWAFRKE